MQNKKKEYDIEGLGMAADKANSMSQPSFQPVGLKLEKQSTPIVPMRADGYQMAVDKANSMKQPEFKTSTLFPVQGVMGGMKQSAKDMAAYNVVKNKDNKEYDPNLNYTELMYEAIARGDYGAAKEYERLHNLKNGDLGLGWENSGIFNYLDTKGIGGLKEAKYNEIQDYINQGFNYNYEEDPEYKAIRSLKEKEADKAYKDGYAQLSTAFDGDIPVNMINKLISSKNEITDQADEYIPQLRQMAYNMYMDKGNNLYNQYNMLANEEATDYNRWLSDRDMFIQGAENAYGRASSEDQTAYQRGQDAINNQYRYDAMRSNTDIANRQIDSTEKLAGMENQYKYDVLDQNLELALMDDANRDADRESNEQITREGYANSKEIAGMNNATSKAIAGMNNANSKAIAGMNNDAAMARLLQEQAFEQPWKEEEFKYKWASLYK